MNNITTTTMKGFSGNSVILIGTDIFSMETVTTTTPLITAADPDNEGGERVVIPAGTEVEVIVPRESNPQYVRVTVRLDSEDELGEEVGGMILASAIGSPTWTPLTALFTWSCVVGQSQYDHNFALGGATNYDRIIIDGVTYNFTQAYNRTVPAEFDSMAQEIIAILENNALGSVVWVNSASENLTIFAAGGLGIALSDGVLSTTLDTFAGSYLKVENTSTGTYDSVTWDIGGSVYTGSPNDFIDPVVGDVLGTFETFYLSPPISTSVTSTTLTVSGGGDTADVTDNIGAC